MLGCLNKYCIQHIKNCYHSSLPTKEGGKEGSDEQTKVIFVYIYIYIYKDFFFDKCRRYTLLIFSIELGIFFVQL